MRRIIIAYLWILAITNIYGMEIEKVDFSQDLFQESNSINVEENYPSKGGFKHFREEEKEDKKNVSNEINPLSFKDIFYTVSTYLNFEDRVTRLGATCSEFRHWIIREITEFSDEFEYDLWDINQDLVSNEKICMFVPPENSAEFKVLSLLTDKHKIPKNFILENIFCANDDRLKNLVDLVKNQMQKGHLHDLIFGYIKKICDNNYIFQNRYETKRCLKFIPLDYSGIFLDNGSTFTYTYTNNKREVKFRSLSMPNYLYSLTDENKCSVNENSEREISEDQSNQYLKIFTNLTVLDLDSNSVITDDTLRSLTNLKKLSLSCNDIITGDTLRSLTNLKKLSLSCNDIITDDTLKYLTNLQKLNLKHNSVITAQSVVHLTNLTSLQINTITYTLQDNFLYISVFGPILETLPKLKHLKLFSHVPINYENLFGLTNLTRLDIDSEGLYDNYSTEDEGNFEHNFHIINSKLRKHLPKLDCLFYKSYHYRFSETRDQFNAKKALRKKLLEKTKQENPYCSWKEIDEKVEAELKKQTSNNG